MIRKIALTLCIGQILASILYSSNTSFVDSLMVKSLIDSSLFVHHKDEDRAIEMAKEALELSITHNYTRLEIDAMNVLGGLYYIALENIDSGYRFITEAYEMAKVIDYKKGIGNYLYYKGVIEVFTGNFNEAEIFYSQALELAKIAGHDRLKAAVYLGISHVKLNLGDIQQSVRYVDSSNVYWTRADDKYEIINSDMQRGYLYSLLDSNEISKACYQNAIDMLVGMGDSVMIMYPKSYMAMVYIKEKNYTKAIEILEETVLLTKGTKYYDLYRTACYSLSGVYSSLKMYDKAYFYQSEAFRIRDSVYTVEKLDRFYDVQMAYERAQKEKETNELKRANEINSLKIKHTRYTAFFVSSFLLLLSILLFVVSKRHKFAKEMAVKFQHQQEQIYKQEKRLIQNENEKIKQKLEYQKRDLTSKVFQLSQNNELRQRLTNSLKALQLKIKTKGQVGEELRSHVQKIINEIEFASNSQMWDEFELYFNKVNPGFINWLSKKYPGLTKNEIRLCVFSLLNLKTNEISKVTFQSSKTISVARTRLRKKLGLDNKSITITSHLHNVYSGPIKEAVYEELD